MDSKNILSVRKKILKYYFNVIVAYFHGKNVQQYILDAYILKKYLLFHLAVILHKVKNLYEDY